MSKSARVLLLVLLHQVLSQDRAQAAAKPSDSALSFLVLGDWGGQPRAPYTTPAEVAIAAVMGTKAAEIGSKFTLALGDNFYDTGVRDVADLRFKETFEV